MKAAWAMPFLLGGLFVLGVALIAPELYENEKVTRDFEAMRINRDHFARQLAVYEDFIQRIRTDPTVLERLANLQRNLVREGRQPLFPTTGTGGSGMERSPFELVTLSAPVLPPPPTPGPWTSILVRHPRLRLLVIAGSLFLVAAGLLLGGGRPSQKTPA